MEQNVGERVLLSVEEMFEVLRVWRDLGLLVPEAQSVG